MLKRYDHFNGRSILLLTIASLAYAIIYFDQGMMSVVLPSIEGGFAVSTQTVQWVLQAYFLVMAALAMFGGHLGDRVGLKQCYVIGVFLFAWGAIVCACSHVFGWLLVGRVIQACGAALMMPVSQAIIHNIFSDRLLGRAMGYYGAIAVLFLSFGPYVGGVLVTHLGWTFVFYSESALALVSGICALTWIPWFKQLVHAAPLNGGALMLLLRRKRFFAATLLFFWLQAVLMMFVVFASYLQRFQHISPKKVGFILLIFTLLQMVISPIAGTLTDRFGAKKIVILFLIGLGIGFYALAIPVLSSNYLYVLPGLTIYSVALAFVITANFKLVMQSVPGDQQASAAGIGFAARQMGGALGLMAMNAFWLSRWHHDVGQGVSSKIAYAHGFSSLLMMMAVLTVGFMLLMYKMLSNRSEETVLRKLEGA